MSSLVHKCASLTRAGTWNSLGQQPSDEKLINTAQALADHNINITNFIIDDGWQTVSSDPAQDRRGWSDFEADPVKFPRGLKDTITRLRSTLPSIQHVAVWHALWGYWGGFDPNGKLTKKYNNIDIPTDQHNMTVITKEDIGRLYDDFYRFLTSCGIDSVKTE